MKHFDFTKGFINESKQELQESERIDEFFGALLLCGALAFMCSGSIFSMFSSIQEKRAEFQKNKAERLKNKAAAEKAKDELKKDREARRQEKEDERKAKEAEELKEQTDKTTRQLIAFKNAIDSLEDGPEKEKMKKQLDSMNKVMSGGASMKELKEIERLAKSPQPDKIQRFIDRVGARAGRIPDSVVKQYQDANGISTENLIAGADKIIAKQLEPGTEDKTDDELKQELKDKYSAEGAEVPEEYQNKDTKKFDPATIDALSGDALKQAATAAGIETTKPKTKPADEEEDKTDDELKQEIKDLKDEEQIKKLPDSVKTPDGKIDPDKVDKLSGDELKQAASAAGVKTTKPKQGEPKPKTTEEEDKTDDELKQEIKDLKDEEQIKKLPDSVKTPDGKIDPDKVNKLSGDELKQAASAAGIKTTKPKQGEPKPAEEKDEYTYLDNDDNEIVVKREKQDDGTYKYTKTIEGGEPTEASEDDFNKAKEEEGEEVGKDDVRDENDKDDELEDEDTTGTKKQDPHKVWKRRIYKRGDKTFKTKLYYNKAGKSISAKDFKEKVKKFKNESFNGWKMTPLSGVRKPATIKEAQEANDMVTICKERLVYIKFVMDTTSNSVEKVKMERMYNAIYNCCFDSNGKPRSMENLYTYLNETMIENKGKIPGLPNNDQITNIDDKLKAWRKTSPNKFDAYMARLEKENLDKTGTKKSDKAKDLLSPEHGEGDSKAIDKIRKLSDIYGFTNILGLEPSRKASADDANKKDEIEKQQKDGSSKADAKDSKDINPEDVSDEQIDKIIGVSGE